VGGDRRAYLAEVIVSPEFRRKGVARRLVEESEEDAQGWGADHLYLYVYGPNDAAKHLFGGLGYSNVDDIKNVYVLVYKRAEISAPSMSYSVERMKKDDIGSAVELINGYYRGWRHFEPFTAESFESHLSRIPGYGLDDVWVAEDGGEIMACAGLWDCSNLADFCYARELLSWKAMGLVLRSLSRFTRVPRIAREGEYFKFHFLTGCAF